MLARNLRSFIHLKKRQNAASLLHYIFNEKPSKCARTQVSIIPRLCICDDNKWLLYNCHHSCQLRPLYFDSKTAHSISLCKEKKSMQTCNSQDLIVNSPLQLSYISLSINQDNFVFNKKKNLYLINLSILITCLLSNVWIFWGEVAYKSLLRVEA